MGFREHLDRAVKNGVDIDCAYVAREVAESECFGQYLDDEDFEYICGLIHKLIMDYHYTISGLLDAIRVLNDDQKIPVKKITKAMLMEHYCEN